MRKYIRIGVDIAKNCFQVHALESEDCSATKRRLSRSGIVKFLAEVEPCAIGMEACGSAHYWARRFRAMMGHEGETHAADLRGNPMSSAARTTRRMRRRSAEAMSRPNMRFVAVKSEDQQATLMAARKTRELLIKQSTMSVNALRAHLAEFGVIAAKGISHVEELVERAAAADLPTMVQATLGVLLAHNCGLSTPRSTSSSSARSSPTIDAIRSAGWRRAIPSSARSPLRRFWPARQIRRPSNPDRDFAAWLGVTPKQNSTGGKEKFGSITKQGKSRYIRRQLLVLAFAISVLRARRQSAKARVVRLAGRAQSAQTGQGRGGGVGQQARPDRLGDHHHWRGHLSHCHGASAKRRRFRVFQAAATAVRHVSIATARSARCVLAEVR